jgi:hypothetical protein
MPTTYSLPWQAQFTRDEPLSGLHGIERDAGSVAFRGCSVHGLSLDRKGGSDQTDLLYQAMG